MNPLLLYVLIFQANLLDLPDYLQYEILCYLDVGSRRAAFKASNSLANAWAEVCPVCPRSLFHCYKVSILHKLDMHYNVYMSYIVA